MAALVLVAAALVAPCGADPTLLFGHARQNSSIGATAAAFGDSFPHLVQGVLFTYQGNGCGSLSNEERRPSAGQAWIAVVARGDCTFVEKAMLAQANNASAIVIYDYNRVPSLPAPVMCGSPADGMGLNVSIPVVAITYDQYTELQSALAVESQIWGSLSMFTRESSSRCLPDDDFGDDDDPFHWHHGFDNSMLPVLLVGGMLVLTLGGALAALHYYVYVRRRRALLAAQGHLDAGLAWQHNVSLDAVNELPSKVYVPLEEVAGSAGAGASPTNSDVDANGGECTEKLEITVVEDTDSSNQSSAGTHEEATCSICLDDFQAGQKQRLLPCGHVFHATCVDEWLMAGLRRKNKSECPLCKQDPLPERTTNPPANPHMASLISMLNAHNDGTSRNRRNGNSEPLIAS